MYIEKTDKLLECFDKFKNSIFGKILFVLFNVLVFWALLSYIEYFIIYKKTDFEVEHIVKTFALLPILSIIWLRINPLLKKLLYPANSIKNLSKIKIITNFLIFTSLLYELIKYCSQYYFDFNNLFSLSPLRYVPAVCTYFDCENYNSLVWFIEILITLILLFIIYFMNIKFYSKK